MSSQRLLCSECNTNAVQVFNDGTFCYACRNQTRSKSLIKDVIKKPSKILQDLSFFLPKEALNWLYKYHLTREQIIYYKIGWSEEFQRVIIPYYKNEIYQYSWLRDVTGLKKPKWLYNGSKKSIPFLLQGYSKDFVIVTEDTISGIRCNEFADSIALGGLNFKQSGLSKILLNYKKLIVWLDGDKAGRDASHKFADYYKIFRDIREIRTKKDPKEFTSNELKDIIYND